MSTFKFYCKECESIGRSDVLPPKCWSCKGETFEEYLEERKATLKEKFLWLHDDLKRIEYLQKLKLKRLKKLLTEFEEVIESNRLESPFFKREL